MDLIKDYEASVIVTGSPPQRSAAQQFAHVKARGGLVFHSCLPTAEFESQWPADVPAQIHAMNVNPFFVEDGDIDAARELVASANHAELILYAGKEHFFTDSSLPPYIADATKLVFKRVLDFLA